ncbi:Inherit from meNOG: ankyrin 3, node of Ranvier (ankyrin G) [Seminavis robusta]|uniref:Inherit from meNOG: ankyrin 3, node of Ranvier (Ankyrin G) n=1 Tax=Seminavis robusta TaxID=568900 RepID=A0A9N8DWY7_9STRA|nr:Inherit from meNOG: ankyrin 3, node of Ranvier (ankyrin G) [Seminavis robusta]|eukprot:Sro414_g138380.1 Inherit from meNOG: ankyrin 3, node of Ranvier (ankyrin G) (677) ;mRNA; r:58717-60747
MYDNLHDAIWDTRSSLEAFNVILTENPASVRQVDPKKDRPYNYGVRSGPQEGTEPPWGGLPLHAALERGRFDVAWMLLEMYPDAVSFKANKGRLPLHLLFFSTDHPPPLDLVHQVIEANPEMLRIADDCGKLPFHSLLMWARFMLTRDRNQTIEIARAVLTAYPKAAKTPLAKGWYPLHLSVQSGEVELVKMLGEACPEVLQNPMNVQGVWVPISWAARCGYLGIVRLLLEQKGGLESLYKADYKGELPIHAATNVSRFDRAGQLKPAHIQVVRILVAQAPETIMMPKPDGKLPIHEMATNGSGTVAVREAIVKHLIDSGPANLLQIPHQNGSKKRDLPIHLAAERGGPAILKLLLQSAPDTLHTPDGDGLLPIHRATTVPNLTVLAQAAPETLSVPSPSRIRFRGGLPLFVAVKSKKFRSSTDEAQLNCFDFLLAHTPLHDAIDDREGSILHGALQHDLPLGYITKLVAALSANHLLGACLRKHQRTTGLTPLHYAPTVPFECLKEVLNATEPHVAREVLQMRQTTRGSSDTPLLSVLACPALWKRRSGTRLLLPGGADGDDYVVGFGRFGAAHWTTKQPAVQDTPGYQMVKLLVDACRESLLIRNSKGLLPVQVVTQSVMINGEQVIPTEVLGYLIDSTTVFDIDTLEIASNMNGSTMDVGLCFEYLLRFPDVF